MAKNPFRNIPPGGPDRYDIELPTTQTVSYDIDGFNDLLRSHGITFIHYKAIRCPVGLQEKYDTRRSHGDHSGCSNGFIYSSAGEITGFFSSNRMESKLIDQGVLDDSTAIVSLPTNYDGTNDPVFIVPYDRFFIKDMPASVSNWELVQYSGSGIDRLQFQALSMSDNIVDARGNVYFLNQDFQLFDGQIKWIPGGQAPGWNVELNKGVVYSVRYQYQPFFYVIRLLHEIRVARVDNFLGGPNPDNSNAPLARLPYQVVLQREYVFTGSSENDPETLSINNPRQGQSPQNGALGPR
jgi:hypothetical protein